MSISSSPDRSDLERLRPAPAERARTVFSRRSAAVCAAGIPGSRVLAHTVTTAGQTLLVVPTDGVLAAAVSAAPNRDLSALVMVTDRAPVPLQNPVRAQVWLSGWLTPVRRHDRRAALLAFAETLPDERLLDVGRSATLLRLDLAEVVLGENGGGTDVPLQDFLAARPDPLARVEADTVRHLDRDHPGFLAALRSLVPAGLSGPDDVLRPLGVDRYGIRIRVEGRSGHHDLRLPFARPLTCPGQLGAALNSLSCVARSRT
ncbi:DUF2470 domain-containing protein [Blastococcus sp. PRF04-17]|uniref:DUF2470 domain-containing protein n=1 Tax=Blastococcus sp. PRF04-17 TaxID=2933797 RepID=UPI001FF16704|nr:DUF2470 domain-containing protein [Blastococcus sp. PRF04-17]UOY02483.1 DUF2470 domain-containing protein [Blastococcus sp. PRF04-17]